MVVAAGITKIYSLNNSHSPFLANNNIVESVTINEKINYWSVSYSSTHLTDVSKNAFSGSIFGLRNDVYVTGG